MVFLARLEDGLISDTDDFASMDEDVDTYDGKTADNAANDRAPEEDKDKAADNDVDNRAHDKVVWETAGCTTPPTHL